MVAAERKTSWSCSKNRDGMKEWMGHALGEFWCSPHGLSLSPGRLQYRKGRRMSHCYRASIPWTLVVTRDLWRKKQNPDPANQTHPLRRCYSKKAGFKSVMPLASRGYTDVFSSKLLANLGKEAELAPSSLFNVWNKWRAQNALSWLLKIKSVLQFGLWLWLYL